MLCLCQIERVRNANRAHLRRNKSVARCDHRKAVARESSARVCCSDHIIWWEGSGFCLPGSQGELPKKLPCHVPNTHTPHPKHCDLLCIWIACSDERHTIITNKHNIFQSHFALVWILFQLIGFLLSPEVRHPIYTHTQRHKARHFVFFLDPYCACVCVCFFKVLQINARSFRRPIPAQKSASHVVAAAAAASPATPCGIVPNINARAFVCMCFSESDRHTH